MQNTAISPVTFCPFGGGRFEVSPKGVQFFGKDKEGKQQPPLWICSQLNVIAKTRDGKSNEWGRLLAWQDDDGFSHQWAMPLELLEADSTEVRRELTRQGLQVSSDSRARGLLAAYLKVWPIEARARCVNRLGWQGEVYVTLSGSIGHTDELAVFQNAHAIEPAYSESGTAQVWRDTVAALAQGNSRLIFALSVAFASPLVGVANEDSGGFHIRGASSSGKSTTLNLAASVWGKPSSYVRLWRSTTNGLEGLAALHNDNLLILDEIGQIDPSAAGDAAYLLANGQGKARANRNGLARAPQQWRLLFLSAGEESLSAIMERAGKQSSAGQEIRLADIEADAGMGTGIFEVLHDYTSPNALASVIKEVCSQHYGSIGTQWLNRLVADRKLLAETTPKEIKHFVETVAPKDASGQVLRVAQRFGLVAVAGELSTRYGLTGWATGEATNAVSKCFAAWLEGFGGSGNREERDILAHVRSFIETHGASRFEDLKALSQQRIPNRAGFYRTGTDGECEFLILAEAFRTEICKGFNEKKVKQVLIKSGLLLPGNDGRPTQSIRLPGLGPSRVYVIRYSNDKASAQLP